MSISTDMASVTASELRRWARSSLIRRALRAAILEELRFNLALLDELERGQAPEPKLCCALRDFSKRDAERRLVDIETLFTKRKLHERPRTENENYKRWSDELSSTPDLIERCYHRLRIVRFRAEHGLDPGDLGYVKYLLRWSVIRRDPPREILERAAAWFW
jgi:hypothetical protein